MIQQYIIYTMAGVIIYLGIYSYSQNYQKEQCQLQSKLSYLVAQNEKKIYDRQIASYDRAILDITQFYDFELKNINDFKKDDNETECDAGYRMLRNFKY